jgi:hypothetical protein
MNRFHVTFTASYTVATYALATSMMQLRGGEQACAITASPEPRHDAPPDEYGLLDPGALVAFVAECVAVGAQWREAFRFVRGDR